jgi:alkylation response protein AidB-like acyl-CoA dehydrogenase
MESPVRQAIVVHGTDEQRARLLHGLKAPCCVGFSEPDHGSDLAAMETRGDVVGDEVIVTGTKVWLAHADLADSAFVLCQTEPPAPKYQNLSCVVVPLADNNVEFCPIRQMSGAADYFAATFDGARAPLNNIVGGRGNGWRVAMATLAFARGGSGSPDAGSEEREFWDLVDIAHRSDRAHDPLVRQQLAELYTRLRMLRVHRLRHMDPSLENILRSEYRRLLGETAVRVVGTAALLRPEGEGYATSHWQHVFLSSPGEHLALGTAQIQRNVLAERVLGLPK